MNDTTNSGDAGSASTPRKPAEQAQAKVTATTVQKSAVEIQLEAMQSVFERYVKEMPINAAVNADVGANNQLRLWKVIQNVLATEGKDFHTVYDALLKFIALHRNTCFHDRYAFRFQDKLVTLSKAHRMTFERVLNMMLLTAEPTTRAQILSRYDWTHLRRSLGESNAGEKISEYYQL